MSYKTVAPIYFLTKSVADRFSVIVVNWNGEKFLPRCLSTLSQQTRAADEIIVIDNASSDDSVAYIRNNHPEIHLITLDENIGFAAANNRGAQQATGEWLVLLNPDAFPEPDWLAEYADAIQRHPGIDSFAGTLICADRHNHIDGTGDEYHISGLAWRRDHNRLTEQTSRAEQPVFSACGASALFRRSTFLQAGGFDEDFFCYMEDVDLGFRLRLAGHQCLFVPKAVAYHQGSASTGKNSDFSIYHGHRNLTWVYLKNMPSALLWLYLPLHIGACLAAILVYSYRGQGKAIVRAKKDALRQLPQIIRKRKITQQTRVISALEIHEMMRVAIPQKR